MSNFLLIITPPQSTEAERLFRAGLATMRDIKGVAPHGVIEHDWARAASFARGNGSGAPPATDAATGSWLLAVGSWFHADGYCAGDEARLLQRALTIEPQRLARELEGFFVIVFGDGRTRETFVLTDIIGSRHAFARELGGVTALSSSSRLLARLGEATLDAVACEEFLRTGVVYEDRSFYCEVRKLAPATVYRFANGTQRDAQRYWRIADLEPDSLASERAVDALSETLVGAARKITNVFGHPVCDLTGGYDSRALVAALLSADAAFETTVSGAPDNADVTTAAALAQITGKPHHHLELSPRHSFADVKSAVQLTDGEFDSVEYTRVHDVHRHLSQHFDLSLNGSFGEVARGYWWELLLPRTGARAPLDARKVAAGRYLVDPDSPLLFPPAARMDLVAHFTAMIERANAELRAWPNTTQMDNTYLTLRMQRWQGRIASSTDQIWPCLSPFMFRSVLETMLQIKAQQRQRSLVVRQMMARLQPRLAAYPLELGYPPLPMTWRTWPRFAPALKFYGVKAWHKARRKLGAPPPAAASSAEPPRVQLWREDEVRELLRPERMHAQSVIDRARLRAFLAAAQQPGFQFERQWQRLLSLECALCI